MRLRAFFSAVLETSFRGTFLPENGCYGASVKRYFLICLAVLVLAAGWTFQAAPAVAHDGGHGAAPVIAGAHHGAVSGAASGVNLHDIGHRHGHPVPGSSDQCTLAAFCVPFFALAEAQEYVVLAAGHMVDGKPAVSSMRGRVLDRDPPVPRR